MTKVPDARPSEPSAASLDEMPEINEPRFRRRPGRGHHASRGVGELVTVDDVSDPNGSSDALDAPLSPAP
jgi:hypothetical protein